MRQHLFGGTQTLGSSGACLHPVAFFFQENLLFPAWRNEPYPTLFVSHLRMLPFFGGSMVS
jgi:hypothetical protein